MKIVVNRCYGGFSISREAAEFMALRGNLQAAQELKDYPKKLWYGFGYSKVFVHKYSRTDPDLILAVETLGEAANGKCADLEVVEIPDGIEYEIREYDGKESINEVVTNQNRSW